MDKNLAESESNFLEPGIIMTNKKTRPIIVAVSGGFDPLHVGHIRLFQEARRLGDKLIVILNNDNWLKNKKGYVFMSQKERREIIEAISWVDKVIYTRHRLKDNDMSVCQTLERIKPYFFANGGDRTKKSIPEADFCKKIGCRMVFNVGQGGKIQSSSWLLNEYRQKPIRLAVVKK